MKTKFTSVKVLKFDPPAEGKNQVFYWDSDTPSLSVRVTQNENRSYIFQSRVSGKSIRITIGGVTVWSLDDARKEARRLQQLCDQGIDPRRSKAEENEKNSEYSDFQEQKKIRFETAYLEYVEENKTAWSDRYIDDHYTLIHRGGEKKKRGSGLTIPGVLASLLDKPLYEINAEFIIYWQIEEAKTRPTRAALGFRTLRAFINWCMEHEVYSQIVNEEAHKSKRVRKVVPTVKAKKQAIQRNQLATWFKAVNDLPNIMHRAFLQITILTGPRSESMRGLEYHLLDFKWKTIKVWDKVDQDYRIIPMTRYVEKLLLSLPKHPESNYVFWSTQSDCGYVTDVRKKYYQHLKEKGLPRFTIHDLRRSFSNLTEWLDVPAGVVAQIMGHKPSATQEKHYKDRPVDLLRIHHQRIEDWILTEAEILDEEKGA
ncbi:tyrosine-type recombinase/integrase [Acinetobacter sp. ABJ_C5_2]|uniref:tyrosine-type recombinase/integrase n=1 Tax=Acinetobacter sp. ABJ_C5_2 TaxID=3376992 RepID=UPI0037C8B49C